MCDSPPDASAVVMAAQQQHLPSLSVGKPNGQSIALITLRLTNNPHVFSDGKPQFGSRLATSPSPPSASSAAPVTPPSTPQQVSPPLVKALLASSPAPPAGRGGRRARQQSAPAQYNGSRKASKRNRKESVPDESKDEKYWKRRAKNNEAAKRSRDLRREKEHQIMQRVTFLERENSVSPGYLRLLKWPNPLSDLVARVANDARGERGAAEAPRRLRSHRLNREKWKHEEREPLIFALIIKYPATHTYKLAVKDLDKIHTYAARAASIQERNNTVFNRG